MAQPSGNSASPLSMLQIDPVLGVQASWDQVCNYTQITTAGTTTLKATAGIYFGAYAPVNGTGTTSTSFYVLDGTTTMAGTSTVTAANQNFVLGPQGVGIRCTTSILVVTAGTGVSLNGLWD